MLQGAQAVQWAAMHVCLLMRLAHGHVVMPQLQIVMRQPQGGR
jgi:hypothetical protein